MHESEVLRESERQMEAVLKSLVPAANPVDPMAAAFAAGKAAGRRGTRMWQGGCAVAAILALAVWVRPVGNVAPEKGVVSVVDQQVKVILPDESALRIEMDVVDRGLDALPPVRGPAPKPIAPNLY